jgi:hypothetical protein
MSNDNPYYRELMETRSADDDFAKKYLLGEWKVTPPRPLSEERLAVLSSDPRKAEFVTLEETISMAHELLEFRRTKKP